jgi:hypothetical protein
MGNAFRKRPGEDKQSFEKFNSREDSDSARVMVNGIIQEIKEAQHLVVVTEHGDLDHDAYIAARAMCLGFHIMTPDFKCKYVQGPDQNHKDDHSAFYLVLMSNGLDVNNMIYRYLKCNVVYMQKPTPEYTHVDFIRFMADQYSNQSDCKISSIRYANWKNAWRDVFDNGADTHFGVLSMKIYDICVAAERSNFDACYKRR